MKTSRLPAVSPAIAVLLLAGLRAEIGAAQVHVWEKVEIELTAGRDYANPYTDADVWVRLQGPGFDKKVYGFWDGDATFRVRMLATRPGQWRWTSHSRPVDPGLEEKSGEFTAVAWTEAQKKENPNRRGVIRSTPNGHALQYADGSPFFLLADTWWAASTWRYPLKGETPNPNYVPGPGIGLEEALQFLKRKGYNSIAIIACFPNWDDDGEKRVLDDDAGVPLRAAWRKPGGEAKDMHDEQGNRPFLTPGKCKGKEQCCADFDRIHPPYWQSLDKKFDYLWTQGFVPWMEAVRRDHGPSWRAYYDFDESFCRYLKYLRARYGVYNWIFSLLHMDVAGGDKNLPPEVWDAVLDSYYKKYGDMPFGVPTSCQGAASTLKYFGHGQDSPWLKIHGIGNSPRDHGAYAHLEEIFRLPHPLPAFNNEAYYTAWRGVVGGERAEPNSNRDNYWCRVMMYGSVLSGGLAGHIHGTGAYDGNTTGEQTGAGDHPTIWEALKFPSTAQMQHLREFILSEDGRYQDLELASDDLSPRKSAAGRDNNLDGWAYMMRLPDRRLALLFFERQCQQASVAGMRPNTPYRAQWFDPRSGRWSDAGAGALKADAQGRIRLPKFPDGEAVSHDDWGLKLRASPARP